MTCFHGKISTWTRFHRIPWSLGLRSSFSKLGTSEHQFYSHHNYINVSTLSHTFRIYACQKSISSHYVLLAEVLRANFHSSSLFSFLWLGPFLFPPAENDSGSTMVVDSEGATGVVTTVRLVLTSIYWKHIYTVCDMVSVYNFRGNSYKFNQNV